MKRDFNGPNFRAVTVCIISCRRSIVLWGARAIPHRIEFSVVVGSGPEIRPVALSLRNDLKPGDGMFHG